MEKHKFNIFPEMSAEEFDKLKSDLAVNGFDGSQPIVVYENAILDGWNRFRVCDELGIGYAERNFLGTPTDALNFVMRTNKRRNLTSQQWAAIAADADDIIQFLTEVVEKERREKQAESLKEKHENGSFGVCGNLLPQTESEEFPELIYELEEKNDSRDKSRVTTKLAQTFNTNRNYVQQARKLKETAPEKFEAVKKGETTFQQIKKEVIELSPEAKESLQKRNEIKNGAGAKWRDATYKIYLQLTSISDNGGIEKLTANWTSDYKKYWLDELRNLQNKIGAFADSLETTIDG